MAFFKRTVDSIMAEFHSVKQKLIDAIENNALEHDAHQFEIEARLEAQKLLADESTKAQRALQGLEQILGIK